MDRGERMARAETLRTAALADAIRPDLCPATPMQLQWAA